MRMHVVKHVVFEGPGSLTDWARERGYTLRVTELGLGESLPAPGDFDALVLMGGPMSVNDEGTYPWLAPEKALVRAAIARERKLLGICLGAQMIASALGARVYPNSRREIGFFPVTASPESASHPCFRRLPRSFEPFHWHGETFDLPEGAVPLAASEACAHQAYALGAGVLALQCHLEVDRESLRAMVDAGAGELALGGPSVQKAHAILESSEKLAALPALCRMLLDDWIAA